MVTSTLTGTQDEVERRRDSGFKVDQELEDIVPEAERNFDSDQGVTTWFYWSPSPGVRCYTYGEAPEPV